jgi:hypothetical protein
MVVTRKPASEQASGQVIVLPCRTRFGKAIYLFAQESTLGRWTHQGLQPLWCGRARPPRLCGGNGVKGEIRGDCPHSKYRQPNTANPFPVKCGCRALPARRANGTRKTHLRAMRLIRRQGSHDLQPAARLESGRKNSSSHCDAVHDLPKNSAASALKPAFDAVGQHFSQFA